MRFIMMMVLAIVSSGAAAEWVKVDSSTNSGGFETYADPATISRSGNMAKMWRLSNFKTLQTWNNNSYFSDKTQNEYDCKDKQYRALYFTLYAGNMGGGNTVYSNDGVPTTWRPIPTNSVSETLWKLACGKQ